jgi:hypothetical protein
MTLKERVNAFAKVGGFVTSHFSKSWDGPEAALHEGLDKVAELAHQHNNWFIPKFVNHAMANIGSYLNKHDLETFTAGIREPEAARTIAIICAGNIPLVGWHDIMCVLLSGNKALIKLSTDDDVLLPFFLRLLTHFEPRFEDQIGFASGKLGKFDAVIATGSNNTASHFRYYFGKYPHIIRHNRTSVAVLTGNETREELQKLGDDIFLYFGLGCRNVSKVLVPEGYNFNKLFESVVSFGEVVNNKKYGNNYDYYRAIYLLERQPFLDNNFLMIKESEQLHAPVGTLYYQQFDNETAVQEYLKTNENELQCVVGKGFLPFGYSQQPVITEFADKVNTLSFLVNL